MFKAIFTYFGSAKYLPDKDPTDFTLTDSSRPWTSYRACPKCFRGINTFIEAKQVCPDCGNMGRGYWGINRRYRKIVKNGKWIYQYINE